MYETKSSLHGEQYEPWPLCVSTITSKEVCNRSSEDDSMPRV
jgi:hypothetical protein